MSIWGTYDAATDEQGTLEPLHLCVNCGARAPKCSCGKTEPEAFVFPKQPVAAFGVEITRLTVKHKGKVPVAELIGLLPLLIGPDRIERLKKICTETQIARIEEVLLVKYGFLESGHESENEADPLEQPPPKKARRRSASRSSKTSGSSRGTSSASSKSKTSAPA